MLALTAVLGVIGYLLIGCVVSAVVSATNWFGLMDVTIGGKPDAFAAALTGIFWPAMFVAAVVVPAVLGPFLLCRLFARKLAKRLNPKFDGWSG